jgi:phage shock protein PspC (stress-responsive transcriptional regulator)
MFCSSCQTDIAPCSKFCCNCGAKQLGTPDAAAPGSAPAPKRIFRSRTDKIIAGVCAGLADCFDLDPTLVRVLWLLAFFYAGFGLLTYIAMWIVTPVAPPTLLIIVSNTPARA